MKSYDCFGVPVSLNYDGEDTFKTTPGAILTMFLYLLCASYAIVQLAYMLTAEQWNLNQQLVVASTYDMTQDYNFSDPIYSNLSLGVQLYKRRGKKTVAEKKKVMAEQA